MSQRSEKRLMWCLVFVAGLVIAGLPLTSGRSVFFFLDVPAGVAAMVLAHWNIRRLRRRTVHHSLTQE